MWTSTPLTKAQTTHSMGTVIVSAAVFVIVLIWLVIVAMNLAKVPIYNSDGTLKLGQYARAKDIFALVLASSPLLLASGLVRRGRSSPKTSRQRHRGGAEDAGAKVRDLVRSTAHAGWY